MFCLFVYSKDVRLPVQLQRAMAAEAEAAREARAKVKLKPVPVNRVFHKRAVLAIMTILT